MENKCIGTDAVEEKGGDEAMQIVKEAFMEDLTCSLCCTIPSLPHIACAVGIARPIVGLPCFLSCGPVHRTDNSGPLHYSSAINVWACVLS